MLSKTLQLLAQDLGLRVEENSACGIYEGYMISLYEAKGSKSVLSTVRLPTPRTTRFPASISPSLSKPRWTRTPSPITGISGMGLYMTSARRWRNSKR